MEVDPAFLPREGGPPDDSAGEFSLSPQEFNRKFKGSPVKRAKRRGYLRNTAVVVGNRWEEVAVEGLGTALKDFEPLVRAHAAWALGRIGGEAAGNLLRAALAVEEDVEVTGEIRSALEKIVG